MAVAETSSFLQPYVYFTLADPAPMPISLTHVAAGYPLCKPFILVLLHIGVDVIVWSPRIYICAGTCGGAKHRDLWSSFYSRGEKHEGSCCLCAKGSRVNCMPCS